MGKPASLDRRRFLQVAATTAASGSAISCSRAGKRWRFFTDGEAATLGAICDQIIWVRDINVEDQATEERSSQ